MKEFRGGEGKPRGNKSGENRRRRITETHSVQKNAPNNFNTFLPIKNNLKTYWWCQVLTLNHWWKYWTVQVQRPETLESQKWPLSREAWTTSFQYYFCSSFPLFVEKERKIPVITTDNNCPRFWCFWVRGELQISGIFFGLFTYVSLSILFAFSRINGDIHSALGTWELQSSGPAFLATL